MRRCYLYIIVFFWFIPELLIAQVEEDRVKASLIYYISDYIEWPEEENIRNYTIGILGENDLLYNELEIISREKNLKGKTISLTGLDDVQKLSDFQILYVTKAWHSRVNQVIDSCRENSILLFTDQLNSGLYSMIDFYENPEDNSINFKVNKQNLILSRLNYDEELLLYGGSMLDVRELYNSTQQLLEHESQRAEALNIELSQKDKELNDKDLELKHKNEVINRLAKNIRDKSERLNNLSDSIVLQNELLVNQLINLENQHSEIQSALAEKKRLYELNEQLSEENDNKNQENLRISDENKLLLEQKKSLEEQIFMHTELKQAQEAIIKSKNKLILLSVVLVASFGLIGLLLLRSNRQKQKSNQNLHKVNEYLEAQKEELEQTLNQLKLTQNQLIESEKLATVGMLATGVSHEINNPLNYIQGGIFGLESILEKENIEITEDIEILISSIKTGVERASDIVTSLNHFNRKADEKFHACDLKQIIHNCLTMLKIRMEDKIETIIDYTDYDLVCPGNENSLHQAFINIFNNAIDAVQNQGVIHISGQQNENTITITIRDNGPGIPSAILSKITEPFFTTKAPGQGTGLGLSITNQIITDHQGNLKIESIESEGTSVCVSLPIN